ncbi:hypothetical protein [Nocardiopsis halotolerans]|uniref:hypothetical protein n=1 Tax=Nocardiopsis halotolerans TaxID=124252 RepID=UPI00034D7D88|nr:hypothetical protein [Nocardiopsis halotolerans]
MSGDPNDEALGAAVHAAFHRQARSAPASPGLLGAVRARSQRRRVRDTVASGLALVLVVAAALAGVWALPLGDDRLPIPAATPHSPGVFAADEVRLCLVRDVDGLAEVLLSARTGGDVVRTAVTDTAGDQRFRVRTEHADTYTLHLEVLRGTPAGQPLEEARDVTVEGVAGRLGDGPRSGDRTLYLGTGVPGSTLALRVEGTGPEDARMLAWAEKLTVDTGRAACDH